MTNLHGSADSTTAADQPVACTGWDNGECVGTVHCPARCPRFFDKYGTPWIIRPAAAGDREGVVSMYEAFDPDDRSMGLPPLARPEIEAWIDRLFDVGRNFVAVGEEGVVGHAVFAPTDAPEPEFAVYVLGSAHGRGIGTELGKHAIAFAAEEGHDRLALDVARENHAATRIYRSLGFEDVGDRYGPGAGSDVRMELSLRHPIARQVRLAPGNR